jgi:hypothetical protein
MSPVRAAYLVLWPEVCADASGDCLFADVQVDEAWNLGFAVGAGRGLLKSPENQHLAIQGQTGIPIR